MLSGQRIRRIILRQLLRNVWIFFVVFTVVLQLSAPYSSTDFTLELNSWILVLVPGCPYLFKLQESCPGLTDSDLLSASVPPCISTMLPRQAKLSIYLSALPSSLMRVVLSAFTFSTLLLTGGCSDLCFFAIFRQSFPAFAVGCARGGLSCPQSTGHQAESKVSTVCHSVSVLWMSS